MLTLMRQAEQVARSDASVLITGESGTGKEVLARHIHRASRRANGPFIALNCAAIPETFSKANFSATKKAPFPAPSRAVWENSRQAEGGTLLLDEISEMDVRLQAKLLRAIQEREIDRLGGSSPVQASMCASSPPATATCAPKSTPAVFAKIFTSASTSSICACRRSANALPTSPHSPSHYARLYSEANGLPATPAFQGRTRPPLCAHGWRGNVRELENTLHRAVLLADGQRDRPRSHRPARLHLTHHHRTQPPAWSAAAWRTWSASSSSKPSRTRWAIVPTPPIILGISIRALRNKLRDYTQAGVQVPPPNMAGSADSEAA